MQTPTLSLPLTALAAVLALVALPSCKGGHDHASGDHAHDAPAAAPDAGHGEHDHGAVDGAAPPAAGPTSAPVQAGPVSFDAKPAVGAAATCPVSGESFAVDSDTVMAEHEGRWYAFCCAGCEDKFRASPAEFADKSL